MRPITAQEIAWGREELSERVRENWMLFNAPTKLAMYCRRRKRMRRASIHPRRAKKILSAIQQAAFIAMAEQQLENWNER